MWLSVTRSHRPSGAFFQPHPSCAPAPPGPRQHHEARVVLLRSRGVRCDACGTACGPGDDHGGMSRRAHHPRDGRAVPSPNLSKGKTWRTEGLHRDFICLSATFQIASLCFPMEAPIPAPQLHQASQGSTFPYHPPMDRVAGALRWRPDSMSALPRCPGSVTPSESSQRRFSKRSDSATTVGDGSGRPMRQLTAPSPHSPHADGGPPTNRPPLCMPGAVR